MLLELVARTVASVVTDEAFFDAQPEDLFEQLIDEFIATGQQRGLSEDEMLDLWEKKQAEIADGWSDVISNSTATGGELVSQEVLAKVRKFARADARDLRRVERMLRRQWGAALDLYRLFYNSCLEVGGRIQALYIADTDDEYEWRTGALLMVHARACTTASEVHALLRTGHPNGAFARWRTMHELAVVAFLLADADETLSERFVSHVAVGNWKDAQRWQDHAETLGHERFTDAEMQELADARDELRDQFGADYCNDWGWALPLFPGRSSVTFVDLAERVDLAHHRPYVNLANHTNHGGSKGSYLNRVEFPDGTFVTLGGSTTHGLAEPASAALIALNHVTIALLNHRVPTMRSLIETNALQHMLEAACDAFEHAEPAV